MILLVDNNDERAKDIQVKLRLKGYTVSTSRYDELVLRTKPVFTIYINPTNKEVSKMTNGDTISIVFCDRKSVMLPLWSINFDSLNNIADKIIEVYKEKCKFQLPRKVDVVGYACMKDGIFALGGKIIRLSIREKEIVRFYMAQPNKSFSSYDASSYIRILTNPEENYRKSISTINSKARRCEREPLILYKNDRYFFNPEIASFVCQDIDEEEESDNAECLIMFTVQDEY